MNYFFCLMIGSFSGGSFVAYFARTKIVNWQTAYEARLEEMAVQEAQIKDYKRRLRLCYFDFTKNNINFRNTGEGELE